MSARENLRDNVDALVKERWSSHKPAIEASGGRLSNGVLGRIRSPEGENVSLDKLDALAEVFEMQPFELLIPRNQGGMMNGWPLSPELLAALHRATPAQRRIIENQARVALELGVIPTSETDSGAA